MTNDFKMYTSGGALVANLLAPIFVGLAAILDRHSPYIILTIPLEILLIAWAVWYISRQFVEVKNGQLRTRYFVPEKSNPLIPKTTQVSIAISDIGAVTIGRIQYFEQRPKEFQDEELKKVFQAYRDMNYTNNELTEAGILRTKVEIGKYAAPYIPVMFVLSKNPNVLSITIATKPFSKNGFRKLIGKFRKHGIPVATDPSLGL